MAAVESPCFSYLVFRTALPKTACVHQVFPLSSTPVRVGGSYNSTYKEPNFAGCLSAYVQLDILLPCCVRALFVCTARAEKEPDQVWSPTTRRIARRAGEIGANKGSSNGYPRCEKRHIADRAAKHPSRGGGGRGAQGSVLSNELDAEGLKWFIRLPLHEGVEMTTAVGYPSLRWPMLQYSPVLPRATVFRESPSNDGLWTDTFLVRPAAGRSKASF